MKYTLFTFGLFIVVLFPNINEIEKQTFLQIFVCVTSFLKDDYFGI